MPRPRLLPWTGGHVAKIRHFWTSQKGEARGFTNNYALACFVPRRFGESTSPMAMSAIYPAGRAQYGRKLLPFWVGVGVYALFVLAGNHLLIDPDTMWQIAIGRWIIDHGAVPTSDVYS